MMMMEIEDDEVPSPPSPHPAGTTIGGPNSKRYSDILSLDYCTFRIPYEELNIRFRNGQKVRKIDFFREIWVETVKIGWLKTFNF